jgi:hypothetical protein
MTLQKDRILLALEVVLGVLPITIVGGVYSFFGLLFGSVSLVMSIRALAFGAFAWWFGIFALAAGGLAGVVGLWALVLIAASSQTPRPQMVRIAVIGSGVGTATALAALLLIGRNSSHPPWYALYSLVAPIVVVMHRGRAIARLM